MRIGYSTFRRIYKALALWLANLFGTSSARSAVQAVRDAAASSAGMLKVLYSGSTVELPWRCYVHVNVQTASAQ